MDERTLLLLSWYEKLDDDGKRALVQFLNEKKKASDINQKIDDQTHELSTLINKVGSFPRDILSNVLRNYIADASIYILSKLLRLK